jgi:tetratricopeptide (TPR) repeat protein
MLKARKRISKKEIKEDKLVTLYGQGQLFYKRYGRQIQIGFTAVIAVLVILVLMARSKRSANNEAASQLGIAEFYYVAEQYDQALSDLTTIADTYTGTPAAGKAVYYIGNIYFSRKDLEKAEEYYQKYVKSYGSDLLFTSASLAGIAACRADKQEYSEAADYYQKAWKQNSNGYMAPFYLKEAALCSHLAGDNEKAGNLYRQLKQQYAQSTVADGVDYLIDSM